MSAPDVSPLLKQADLLTELYVERANDIEADPELARDGTFDAAGVLRQSADLIRRLAEALRVESPPPALQELGPKQHRCPVCLGSGIVREAEPGEMLDI